MHRSTYGKPPPAQSPPLHHPVPQHVSTVPQLRSPPPPSQQQQQQQAYGGYGQQQQQQQQQGGGFGGGYPAFGGIMNDTTAQMGFQVGKSAVMAGQEYVEQNFNRYIPIPALKHYFNVSNKYVLTKLSLVLFPWRHKPWSRQQRLSPTSGTGTSDGPSYLPPREDINSPDMYIPLMAFVTYILMYTLLAGLRGQFKPELLGSISGTAVFTVALEIAGLKLVMYLLSVNSESQLLDLVAYSGYKFVGVIVTLAVAEIWNRGGGTGGWVGWTVFGYTFMANAFFLLRSLRYVLLPDVSPGHGATGASYTANRTQKTRRTHFLFIYSYVIQFALMWFLSMPEKGAPTRVGA